jgi:hypothetical protein
VVGHGTVLRIAQKKSGAQGLAQLPPKGNAISIVMAGLVPAIHVLLATNKTWMPGIKPGTTVKLFGIKQNSEADLCQYGGLP